MRRLIATVYLPLVCCLCWSTILIQASNKTREGEIRLYRWNEHSMQFGRIEVYHNGTWGSVCDDGFTASEATVLCTSVGYDRGIAKPRAYFGKNSQQIWIDDVQCVGTESSLLACRHAPWGKTNCDHGEDVGVLCYNLGEKGASDIRLVSGTNKHEGLVHVRVNNKWGKVIYLDDLDLGHTASVVCRQLGYLSGGSLTPRMTFPPDWTAKVWFSQVTCHGSEVSLSECDVIRIPSTQSQIRERGVRCNVGPEDGRANNLRLVTNTTLLSGQSVLVVITAYYNETTNNITPNITVYAVDGNATYVDVDYSEPIYMFTDTKYSNISGRLEVYYKDEWGTVCDDSWQDIDATVACRQLGYNKGTAYGRAHYGPGRGTIWLDNVACHGEEQYLMECPANVMGEHQCTHDEDAGVTCFL